MLIVSNKRAGKIHNPGPTGNRHDNRICDSHSGGVPISGPLASKEEPDLLMNPRAKSRRDAEASAPNENGGNRS
jgi:hypothetical protein